MQRIFNNSYRNTFRDIALNVFYHSNVIRYADASGRMIQDAYERMDYYAFGNQFNGDMPDPFGYCGEYYDSENGFIYLRNRYYDSRDGRFITEDPVKDGLNWYVYANNNPVNFVDPSGEDAIIITNSESAMKQGHTSAIYQDVNGNWFYTYWGNKAAAVIRMPDEYMGSLNDFNNGLNKFLSDNGFKDITSNYNSSTYIVGDFTLSLDAAYADVHGAHSNSFHKDSKTYALDNGSIVFQGQNSPYNLSWDI